MPTNVSITTYPELWSSAYDDIEFIFDFKGYTITGVSEYVSGSVGQGQIRVYISGTWDINPVKNQYCYIASGNHLGLHKVIASNTNSVILDTPYVGTQTSGTIKNCRIPVFTLYKGFEAGEDFPTELPYTQVTQFTPQFNSNIQININLKGLLQRIFEVVEPDITTDFDFSVFNAYRLVWDSDNVTDIRYVLNSSITTAELNDGYLEAGKYLVNTDKPLLFSCGVSFMTRFVNEFPKLEIYNSGQAVSAGFSNAFQANQFSQGYDIQ